MHEFRSSTLELIKSPSQYGGYDPRLVTEWVRVSSQVSNSVRTKRDHLCLDWFMKIPLHPFVTEQFWGTVSRVVKVSDHGRHVMSLSPVPLKTHRVGERCMLNLSRAQTSSSLDHGSKLRGPSPKARV
ncbi:hypothetical protein TNCV_4141491 [Trichonephila clavipes]|nr:hypothetical protein TNCV_4141491 [Trichonephila clavipes]